MRVFSPTSSAARPVLIFFSFVIPLLVWSLFSYVPWIWHPYIKVTDPGEQSVEGPYSYIQQGQLIEREIVKKRNENLRQHNAQTVQGYRANPIYLPAPHEVFVALFTSFKTEPLRSGDQWLHQSLLHSCKIIFWGFIISAMLGVPIGILCGTYTPIASLVEPCIDFIRYMPAPVFGALAVSILGLGDEPKIAIIFIGTFFQMVLIIGNTTRKLDVSLVEAAQTLGANNKQLLAKVIIPGILPDLYRDMRILIGWAWTYLVVAELIGAKSGISAFLYQSQRYKQFDDVYAAILIIGIIGLCTDQILAMLGRYLFAWETGKSSALGKSVNQLLMATAKLRDTLGKDWKAYK